MELSTLRLNVVLLIIFRKLLLRSKDKRSVGRFTKLVADKDILYSVTSDMFTLKWEILIILKQISQLRPRVGDYYYNVQRLSKPNY